MKAIQLRIEVRVCLLEKLERSKGEVCKTRMHTKYMNAFDLRLTRFSRQECIHKYMNTFALIWNWSITMRYLGLCLLQFTFATCYHYLKTRAVELHMDQYVREFMKHVDVDTRWVSWHEFFHTGNDWTSGDRTRTVLRHSNVSLCASNYPTYIILTWLLFSNGESRMQHSWKREGGEVKLFLHHRLGRFEHSILLWINAYKHNLGCPFTDAQNITDGLHG